MSNRPNPRQLVLRRDTATGLTQVGWETDLPVGRFLHIALICELAENILPETGSEFFAAYQTALHQAREANYLMLQQQIQHNQARGWHRVPIELASHHEVLKPDSIGNYAAAAMQLHFHLTHNTKQAWAVLRNEVIVHVRASQPRKELDELTYQVWYQQQRTQLQEIGGTLLAGNLIICESGLWFATDE